MTTNKQQHGTPIFRTGTGATGAYATVTGASGVTVYVTDISASSDKAGAIVQLTDGGTAVWEDIVGGANSNYGRQFSTPIKISEGNNAVVAVDGTSACKANIAGFTISK